MTNITYDSRSFTIDAKREFLISGEMHYTRIPREYWPRVLDTSKSAGLNCVASYIFWGTHEPEPDLYDFSGNADLGHYLDLCAERGISVILRLGPYVCAEVNYGGFPSWLRDIPGITLRTWNGPYIDRLQKYFRQLIGYVKPYLASNGGPVVLAQVENEYNNIAKRYGDNGKLYMDWIARFAPDLGVDVPIITCYGGAKGAIECVNGFSTWKEVRQVLDERPGQPGLWTENWPGWYDIWGHQHHIRDPYEIAYEVCRFIQNGGSGFNYYMWMGGTNFGRSSMYLQTTRYDFDGALDEYGRPTDKYHVLSDLHHAIRRNQDLLLGGECEEVSSGGDPLQHVKWSLDGKHVHVFTNTGEVAVAVKAGGDSIAIPPQSAALIVEGDGRVVDIWKGWFGDPAYDRLYRPPLTFGPSETKMTPWKTFAEPLGSSRIDSERATVLTEQPVEQLSLTRNKSDYCWYLANVESEHAREAQLHLTRAGDYFYVYVNGHMVASSSTPLVENRGPIVDADGEAIAVNELEEEYFSGGREHEFQQRFTIPLKAGTNEIAILSCALGMIKGDWMIAMPMNYERKGLWGAVLLDSAAVTGWRTIPMLLGERLRLHEPLFASKPNPWSDTSLQVRAPVWFCSEFDLAAGDIGDDAIDWAFDADGLDKGLVWVNGNLLGRYWTILAQGYGPDRKFQPSIIMGIGEGEPTQRYYHIPTGWLQEHNRIVILSETGAVPHDRHIVSRKSQQ